MRPKPYPRLAYFLLAPLFALTLLPLGNAQSRLTDSLENQLNQRYGKDKLITLNELVEQYLSEEKNKDALRYARAAEVMAEAIISPGNQLIAEEYYYLKPLTFYQLGQAYQKNKRYEESRSAYEKALVEARLIDASELADQAEENLEAVVEQLIQEGGKKKKGFLGKAFRDIGTTIGKTSDDFSVIANLKLAKMHENNQDYEKAIKKYEQSINQLRNQGDWEQVEDLQEHLAELFSLQGDLNGAIQKLTDLQTEKEEENDAAAVAEFQKKIEEMTVKALEPRAALPKPIFPTDVHLATTEKELKNMRFYAERAESNQDFEASLNYYKQYLSLEQTLAEQDKQQELTLLEKAHQIERQEQEITLLRQNEEISQLQLQQSKVELQRQVILKRSLGGGLVLSGMVLLSLFMLYRNKQRDHQKLGLAYRDLESTQTQLKAAEHKIKSLLNQQVSGAVATALLTEASTQMVQRKFACIMFLDIRNFTPFVEKLSPNEIIEYQNEVLGFMIETINKRKGIVNQILGDGFMATFGAPVSAGNDCEAAYLAAQEIMQTVKEKSESGEIPPTRIGIGLHAGQIVAGNVGTKDRKQYSITGNPVIIAARLEQLNKEFGSTMVVSKEVYDHLPAELKNPMQFNAVRVKGRSKPVEVAIV